MKKILSVVIIALMLFSLVASCGENKKSIKETKVDNYVERYVEAAEKDANQATAPEVTKEGNEKYSTTKITYNPNAILEIYSNPQTGAVNGANLRITSPSATRKADLQYFFEQVKLVIEQSDPTASEKEVDAIIEIFKSAVPDPSTEGYTGTSARTETLNDISYMVYFDCTTDPATIELLVS